jgi:hypothetical protein
MFLFDRLSRKQSDRSVTNFDRKIYGMTLQAADSEGL